MRTVSNFEAKECVRHKTPFRNKSGLLWTRQITYTDVNISKGITTCTVERYVVFSSKAPIYIFDFSTQKWIGNLTVKESTQVLNHYHKVQTTAAKHMELLMPVRGIEITWLDHMWMDAYYIGGVAQVVAEKIARAA